MTDGSPLLDAGDVAKIFGITKRHLLRLIRADKLPDGITAKQIGSRWHFQRSEVERFVGGSV